MNLINGGKKRNTGVFRYYEHAAIFYLLISVVHKRYLEKSVLFLLLAWCS